MGDFNKQSFSSGRGRNFNRSGGGFRDRFSRGPVEMHQAVCDNCGKNCEVPFRPTSGKPIFCSDCFEQKNGGRDSRDSGRARFDRPSYSGSREQQPNYSQQFEQLNKKMDRILAMLESAVDSEEAEDEVEEVVSKQAEEASESEEKKKKAKA